VGQSEVTVRSMVDFFLLVLIAGAGDELQGIKKGVIELADLIAVNKAEGDNLRRARSAKAELNRVLHYLQPATEGWETHAVTLSALTKDGVPELWETVQRFAAETRKTGVWDARRREQDVEWMRALIEEALKNLFHRDPRVRARLPALERDVASGRMPAAAATEELMRLWRA
jgi:LAO/AO transport system kinase